MSLKCLLKREGDVCVCQRPECRRVHPLPKQIPFAVHHPCNECHKIISTCLAQPADFTGPSTIRRAFNFGQAIGEHVIDLCRHVDDQTLRQRWDICSSNECGYFEEGRILNTGKCKHIKCGCVIQLSRVDKKNKILWRSSRCPLKLWS